MNREQQIKEFLERKRQTVKTFHCPTLGMQMEIDVCNARRKSNPFYSKVSFPECVTCRHWNEYQNHHPCNDESVEDGKPEILVRTNQTSSRPPYGYKHSLMFIGYEVNPEEFEILFEIMYLRNIRHFKFIDIARYLNEAEYRTRNNNLFNRQIVRNIWIRQTHFKNALIFILGNNKKMYMKTKPSQAREGHRGVDR